MNNNIDFTPYNKWRRFHKVTFIDYEFTINGKDIEFDEQLIPQQLDVKEGDKFVVKFGEYGNIILARE